MSGKIDAKEKIERDAARQWLEGLLGLEVGDDFFEVLGDGVLLCSIINTIKPGTIQKINPGGRAKKFPAKRMENINNFILGARMLGMLKSSLFEVPEFLEKKRMDRLVKCILGMEKLAIKFGIDRSAADNVLKSAKALDTEDLKKQALIAQKEAEEQKRLQDAEKEREEHDKKERASGKIAEEEYKIRQDKLKKEREEREEKYKKEKEERERKAKEAAAARPASPAASPSTSSSSLTSLGGPRTLYGTDALLAWAQQCTSNFEGVNVTNFTTSWKDGLAFCALVAHHNKELDYASCKAKKPSERLEIAFEIAGKMGVPPLVDPEDICDIDTPDRRSMITYLGCLYKGMKK